jgi:hypothetical protein
VIAFFVGQRRDSSDAGQKLGEFIGRIDTKLENINATIKELKATIKEERREHADAIEHAIREHERAYHRAGSNSTNVARDSAGTAE